MEVGVDIRITPMTRGCCFGNKYIKSTGDQNTIINNIWDNARIYYYRGTPPFDELVGQLVALVRNHLPSLRPLRALTQANSSVVKKEKIA